MQIISMTIPYDGLDEQIHLKIAMLDELNVNERVDYSVYDNYHSIRELDFDLIKTFFDEYAYGYELDEYSSIIMDMTRSSPDEPLDTFIYSVIIPCILDVGRFDITKELESRGVLMDVELYYDSIIFRDDHLVVNLQHY